MMYDIIEAIENYYNDDVDYQAYLLSNLYKTINHPVDKFTIEEWFVDNNYCPYCGIKLSERQYEEHYPYGDTVATEILTEYFCENCDYTS